MFLSFGESNRYWMPLAGSCDVDVDGSRAAHSRTRVTYMSMCVVHWRCRRLLFCISAFLFARQSNGAGLKSFASLFSSFFCQSLALCYCRCLSRRLCYGFSSSTFYVTLGYVCAIWFLLCELSKIESACLYECFLGLELVLVFLNSYLICLIQLFLIKKTLIVIKL